MRPARVVAALAGLCWALLPASPAAAHAELIGTTPVAGGRLDRPPGEVVLRFSERVSPVRDAVRLLDSAGRRMHREEAGPVPGRPEQVRLPVPADLPDGVYVVTWRVASADSHPVAGSFAFSVGATAGVAPATALAEEPDAGVRVTFWAFRGLAYVGLALLAGGLVFLLWCWPAGRTDPRAGRLVRAGWVAGLLATAGVLLLQGPYLAGRSLAGVADPALLSATVDSDYGKLCLARLALLATAGLLAARLTGRSGAHRGWLIGAAAAVLLALPLTWSAAGHARAGTGTALAVTSDGVHLLAMSVWLGGLALLFGCVLAASAGVTVAGALAVLSRFSRLAVAAVGVLVLTGTFQAWRELREAGLSATGDYPRILVFKLAAFGLLLCLAAASRAMVRYRYVRPVLATAMPAAPPTSGRAAPPAAAAARGEASMIRAFVKSSERLEGRFDHGKRGKRQRAEERRRDLAAVALLRRSVRLELAIAAAVLGLTAALVSTSPGAPTESGPSAGEPGSYAATLALPGGGDVLVSVTPARPGANDVSITVRGPDGADRDVPEVTAEFGNAVFGDEPMPVRLERTAPGRYTARAVTLPTSGTWRLRIQVRTTDLDRHTVTTDVPVPD